SVQAQIQSSAYADQNRNGVGEFGYFGELAGREPVRGGEKLARPLLSKDLAKVHNGVVTRGGYHFRIYLPDAEGRPVGEHEERGKVDAARAEKQWCCYAWPVAQGITGNRTFFIDGSGTLRGVTEKNYSGKSEPPAAAALKLETLGSGALWPKVDDPKPPR
ncbi:MAG: hypothetical protein AAGD14_17175, partial [Planctomycetota bacterium]